MSPKRPPRQRPTRADAVTLRAGRDRSVLRGHPWIFSGAVADIGQAVADGSIAPVVSGDGSLLGRGFVNRRSQIVVRMVAFGDAGFDDGSLRACIDRAVTARGEGARRLVHAESDGLPGLVVDRYGEFLVLQITSLGMDRLRQPVVDALVDRLQPRGIFERSEGEGRKKERLEPSTGLLAGQEPPELVAIEEEGLEAPVTLLVDVRKGHKTGTYLDQRISRRRVSRYAPGKAVLNAFSYTGGFGLHAARAGAASVLDIDSSEEALATARASAEKNGVDGVVEHRHGDAFGVLRELRADGRTFDLVILDPPKFVESAAHLRAGSRGYQDINRVAMQLVRPGGHLATFSCSGLVSAEAFQRILWTASREAGKGAQIVERLGQPDDHPVRLDFPEGEYLKGVILRLE